MICCMPPKIADERRITNTELSSCPINNGQQIKRNTG